MSQRKRKRARKRPAQLARDRRHESVMEHAGGSARSVMQLQATAGNRAVRDLLAQRDLEAGEPHPGRQPGAERAAPGERGFVVDTPAPRREGGKLLPVQLRSEMERTFGARLSNVKVHEGQQIADDLGSRAVTIGNDIHFGSGYYQPHTGSGRQVIAHELTHVIQQRSARVKAPSGDGLPVNTDITLESEAERVGRHAAWRLPVKVRGARDVVRRPVDVTAQARTSGRTQPPSLTSAAE